MGLSRRIATVYLNLYNPQVYDILNARPTILGITVGQFSFFLLSMRIPDLIKVLSLYKTDRMIYT